VTADRPDHVPASAMPADTSLVSVLDRLEAEGWTTQLVPLEGGRLRCGHCRSELAAEDCRADVVTRLEGASDPADQLIVVPLICPVCDAHGTFVAHYGPESSSEEADVLAALSRAPSEAGGTEPTPGITGDADAAPGGRG